jgi:Uma2 family endonuclease
MSTLLRGPSQPEVVYPDSDGEPMADNTLQWEWIVVLKCGLEALFLSNPDVFVAGNLLWYAVEGDPTARMAPDVLVVFGRPKGHRGSYMQWLEGNLPPQVVFEVLSPGNRFGVMLRKFRFYERHGVEEYYIYDPDHRELTGYLRQGDTLREIEAMDGWVSPRLGVRFQMSSGDLEVFRPDGQKFATYVEVITERDQERQAREQAQQRAAQERQAREQAERQVEDQAQKLERLAAQLRALGIEPES